MSKKTSSIPSHPAIKKFISDHVGRWMFVGWTDRDPQPVLVVEIQNGIATVYDPFTHMLSSLDSPDQVIQVGLRLDVQGNVGYKRCFGIYPVH